MAIGLHRVYQKGCCWLWKCKQGQALLTRSKPYWPILHFLVETWLKSWVCSLKVHFKPLNKCSRPCELVSDGWRSFVTTCSTSFEQTVTPTEVSSTNSTREAKTKTTPGDTCHEGSLNKRTIMSGHCSSLCDWPKLTPISSLSLVSVYA